MATGVTDAIRAFMYFMEGPPGRILRLPRRFLERVQVLRGVYFLRE